ncbi:ATP-binding cassette domain-containing protein [Microbacterium sp. BLY]|uniref:ABC transporter ATP-binding protein n=1 Tax=Microbacterium sp. BLY TaxID=2823280 RepID=UPI0027DCB32C|nr:ATP-binding cassette domain-containing protein [Microbacterium sp. BLY]
MKTTTAKSAAAKAKATPTKAAAEKAAASADVVVEPTPRASVDPASAPAGARTASAARAAAAKNTAARSAGTTRAPATKKPAATSAAKTAAAKSAAAKAQASKTTARAAAAKTAAAKAAAAKAAATKAAAAKAAEAADLEVSEPASIEAPATNTAVEAPTEAPVVATPVAEPQEETAAPEAPASEDVVTTTAESGARENEVEISDTTVPVTEDPSPEDSRVADVEVVEVVEPVTAEEPPARVDQESEEGAATEAIRIRGLVKQFGENRAVDGIDLTVPAASFYGIVGPNGAGKTTTLSIVAGLLRADEGSVLICGIDQAREPLAAKRVMGVLPDRLRTFDRLTGRQLLYYYGLLRGLAVDVIEKRTADLARAFDLGDALNRVVSDYSAGMTKKIMLAGAMIHSPRVLVLDEPFESVDPVSSAVILDILRAYVSHGGTVILSSHGMDLVERVCSRVAIIVNGEVLAEGTIDEVRAGQTLESRFVELAGSSGEVEGLEWLHTFSD